MIRDMDFIRELLEDISKGKDNFSLNFSYEEDSPLEYPANNTDKKTIYHLDLMKEANLITWTGRYCYFDSTQCYDNVQLTWAGHDYYDVVRNNTVWNKVKNHLESYHLRIEEVSFEIIKGIANQKLKEWLGL